MARPLIAGRHDLGRVVARNEAVGNARSLGIAAPGLRKLRRSFRKLAPGVDRQLRHDLLVAAQPILARGRQLTPRRTGRLARSLRISVQQRGVAITSTLPYANVIHWGGTVGRGHMPGVPFSGSVFIEPSLFLSRAIEEQEDNVVDQMARAVDRASIKAGWNR